MASTKGNRAQKRAKEDFLSALDTALRIYAPTREMCKFDYESFEESTFHPKVAAKVIGLAFLCGVAAWEDFLCSVYLGYLCGYPAPNGNAPRLRCGRSPNRSHALLLASGESTSREAERKMRWSSFKWIKAISKIHFYSENPFNQVSDSDIRWLDYAVTIRNRVAHTSDKAKAQFKEIANHIASEPKGSSLPPGFSPGQLLITRLDQLQSNHPLASSDHHWGDFFEGFFSLWVRLADQICPEPKLDA